jgi:ATPase subunit of ABC transporter with duplicated ATPase domains
MLSGQLSELSGGWRVRAALASILIQASRADVLLLDEPSNHLDIKTVRWLTNHLSEKMDHLILVLVSHDRHVLESVCTDIIVMKDEGLHYFPGSYELWRSNQEEMQAFHENRRDAEHRRAEQIKKSDSGSAQVKKKLERNAMHRNIDGKRFKNFSLKKISEDAVHLAERETVSTSASSQEAHASNRFKLPVPDLTSLRLASESFPLLSFDTCSFTWRAPATSTIKTAESSKAILSDVTLSFRAGVHVAVVGMNGQGTSLA